ncbi:MAG: pyridoxal phosphate-dependent aminotransferase [Syntrophomonadaceae bacterium]|nr:pyridoxal phosphate-dependent aminotransferase [Syntrophomonadaceae bacterium]
MRLADRARGISTSPTMAIDARAKQMTREGIHVISFGVGEPDFDTPVTIKEAAIAALNKGFTKYTSVAGIEDLKQAIVDKLKTDNDLEYSTGQIVVSNGAKHSLYNLFQVMVNPGEEVIVPAPYWVSYVEMIKLAGGVPCVIRTWEENDFKLTPADLEKNINPRTKLLILNSPSNPTGSVYTRRELEALGEVLVRYRLPVISDEIYEKLLYDGQKHVSLATLSPELKELVILVNGVSKSYAMTGWRIGYLAAPVPIAQAVADLQSHSASNPNSFAQWGALEALRGSQEPAKEMVAHFATRREYILERLQGLEGITCRRPGGAFYVFPNVSIAFGKRYRDELIQDAADLAKVLLTYGRIAVVPGVAFGVEGYLRLSYATNRKNIEEGINRFAVVWNELKA